MKRIEKLIIILVTAMALKAIFNPIYIYWIDKLISESTGISLRHLSTMKIILPVIVFPFIMGAISATWLFLEAKSEKLTKWVWGLFGFFFPLKAIIIFYVYAIFINMQKGNKITEQIDGSDS